MTDDEALHPTLHAGLNLDGSPASIKQFYSNWADQYERDTTSWNYAAPVNALYLLANLPEHSELSIDPADREIEIMDAGCGTGLLARTLSDHGYRNISGFDLSEEMVEIARNLNIYRQLEGNVDINEPVRDSWRNRFDCTISIGVFTPGHVPPRALSQLVALTRTGGLVIVSTRVSYHESENYRQVSDQLEVNGKLRLIHSLRNASYTEDEKAHYWAYAVL